MTKLQENLRKQLAKKGGYIASDPDCCPHHHRSLRGCNIKAGHQGPHYNVTDPEYTWSDADGTFVKTHQDWVGMVNSLGKPNHLN